MIGIALDDDTVEAGEFVTGTVHWSDVDRVVVYAEWQTEGKGNRASGIARAVHIPVKRREGSAPFRLLIPYEGPITFAGELIAVHWRVCAGDAKFEFGVRPRSRT